MVGFNNSLLLAYVINWLINQFFDLIFWLTKKFSLNVE